MKFINRKEELEFLSECKSLSKKKLFTLLISGLRRVGKTRLILESITEKDVYFFVNENKSSMALLEEYVSLLKGRTIMTKHEAVNSWDDFFDILLGRFYGTIIFDEFQSFKKVDESILGSLQKNIDLHENKKNGLLIIFSGSLIGLLKEMFMGRKQPLYGRLKRQYLLRPLSFKHSLLFCDELKIRNFDDAVKIYSILGGFPKYYVAIEDESLQGSTFEQILDSLFFRQDAPLGNEVQAILSQELGKRSGTYYKILEAIANGHRTISEIASYMSSKETSLTRQIKELQNYFEIVGEEISAFTNKRRYTINHPLIAFWFRYIFPSYSNYRRKDANYLRKTKEHIHNFIGYRFEDISREFLESENSSLQFARTWGKFKGEKGKNNYEIDLVGFNVQSKEILFVECKYKDNVDAEMILTALKEKSRYVQWMDTSRKEHFCIIAKSFKKKLNKKECICYDLKDMEKVFKNAK